jgi:pimeloyl-ACP methyl ester carboxylesterase
METLTSADGTAIAYERSGSGPALVVATGAFCDRLSSAPLAEHLRDRHTVYRFDRRGRGDSGDTPPWSVDREVEDLAALEAAAAGVPMSRLAVYEPPYVPGEGTTPKTADRMASLCASGQPEDAALLFLRNTGMGDDRLAHMQAAPFWPRMVGLAPQLAYDVRLGNGGSVPVDRLDGIGCPVLALAGGMSPPWATDGAAAIAAAVPQGRSEIVEGQHHGVDQDVAAAVLARFFAA